MSDPIPKHSTSSPDPSTKGRDSTQDIEDHIRNFLGDGRKFTTASFNSNAEGDLCGTMEDLKYGISDEFASQSSYHVRLIAPQIQLQSERNTKAAVLVTAKGMQLKVLQIMDKDRVMDEVSGLVQRRFTATMDSLQIFVSRSFSSSLCFWELLVDCFL